MMILLFVLAQDVSSLIERLGDDDPRIREQAQSELIRAGEKALPALQEASKSADPELRARANAIVGRIEWPALAELEESARKESSRVRHYVLREMTGPDVKKYFAECRVFLLYVDWQDEKLSLIIGPKTFVLIRLAPTPLSLETFLEKKGVKITTLNEAVEFMDGYWPIPTRHMTEKRASGRSISFR